MALAEERAIAGQRQNDVNIVSLRGTGSADDIREKRYG